ncbi:MAG: glycosyltransferase family 1 protein [Anaerolineae bacterium]|nr:glycosyltransferase family 4 protein [Anaerolineae bacterium]MDW8298945.1 glycosyltransferase family 1 protein [Anaerolineae bacterium]
MLRVGIEASGLIAPKALTGVRRYLLCLLEALAAQASRENFKLYLYFISPPRGNEPELANLQPSRWLQWRVAPFERGWWRIGMGIAMLLDRLHLFHFPAPHMARFCPVPAVVTVHDLAALSLPSEQTEKERRYLEDALYACRHAAHLIAVSQNAADEVQRHLGLSATVIYEGVDKRLFQPTSDAEIMALRAQLGIERYVLCVGTLQQRKNQVGLLRAFAQIQEHVPHTLILAGGEGSGTESVKAYLSEHPQVRARWIGYVSEAQLPALYSGAEAFALPSFWEGFGLPVLEAMACGVPVLTSNVSSLAEIAGDAALLVDPHDTSALAEGLLRLLTDSALRERLKAAGKARAAQFTWQQTAQQTLSVYRRLVK